MKSILASVFLSFLLVTSPALAAEQDKNSEQTESPEQTTDSNQPDNNKSEKLFQDMADRTQQLNLQTTDNLLNTPFNTPFAQQFFVPDISLILDSTYVYRSLENNKYGSFNTPGWGGIGEFSKNGFNLNYAELTIASTVDPYFDLMAVLPFTLEGVELEEAFINTRSLPYNFQAKIGKFRSSFGRLNSQHEHFWDFAEPPMVYTSVFGSEQLNETGVQVNWLAPTDTYLLLGAELSQGENENSFGTKGFEVGNNNVSEINVPNLITAFAKSSVDIDNLTILGGLSYAQGNNRLNEEVADPKEASGYAGFSRIYAGDLTLKYFIDSYRYLSLQSEYIYRDSTGTNYTATDMTSMSKQQSGLYSQLIWRFDQLWRAGLRYDLLNKNDIFENNKLTDNPANLAKYSAMVEFNPTEFSRVRLQFNHDRSKFDTNLQPVNEVFLQLNMAIGSHGAHAF